MTDSTPDTKKEPKFKLTRKERNWVLYDVANSAFSLIESTILTFFFNVISGNAGLTPAMYLAYWGYSQSVATAISAVLGPIIGALSDRKGKKKVYFNIIVFLACALCLFMGAFRHWLAFLAAFVVLRSLFSVSIVLYDSMLRDVTTEDRMHNVSSNGYAWGYVGCLIPYAVLALVIFIATGNLDLNNLNLLSIACVVTGLWWFIVSVPFLKNYEQVHFLTDEKIKPFSQIVKTLKDAFSDKRIALFLLAYFFYIDGVFTIVKMSTAYATSMGIDTLLMVAAMLGCQFVACPSALLLGKLTAKHKPTTLIPLCIFGYFCITIYAIFLTQIYQFVIMALAMGLVQGGTQALSRSYFAGITPANKSGEYFGLYDILGKGASFLGTTLMGAVTMATGHQNYGVGAIALFFLVGMILFICSAKVPEKKD